MCFAPAMETFMYAIAGLSALYVSWWVFRNFFPRKPRPGYQRWDQH